MIIKTSLLLITLLFCLYGIHGQGHDQIWFLNKKGEEVQEKKAAYLLQIRKMNDTSWENNLYEIYGPIIRKFYTKDRMGLLRNGTYYSKNPAGGDSSGYYTNNKMDKEWIIRNAANQLQKQLTYAKGLLVKEQDSTEARKDSEEKKRADTAGKSTILTKVEIESDFKGGYHGWTDYLRKNIHYPDRAIGNRIQGTIIVLFIVTKEGKVKDATVERSVEYSLDNEALRIIQNSPDWIPAVQNGVPVNSYKKQPVIFKLDIQK